MIPLSLVETEGTEITRHHGAGRAERDTPPGCLAAPHWPCHSALPPMKLKSGCKLKSLEVKLLLYLQAILWNVVDVDVGKMDCESVVLHPAAQSSHTFLFKTAHLGL